MENMDKSPLFPNSVRPMPPEVLAVQSLCKQLFKSRLFRGSYEQRCYVDRLGSYRDVIVLQRGERDLEKLLLDTKDKLQQLYCRYVPNMWIGISKGNESNYTHTPRTGLLDTCVWAELNDLAFGEYWFNIKSLRFRDQEVILKLKMVRTVDEEPTIAQVRQRHSISANVTAANSATATGATSQSSQLPAAEDNAAEQQSSSEKNNENQLESPGIEDFIAIVQQWGKDIKAATYIFMANDVNKANIIGALKFLGLLVFSILSGGVYGLRFLGIFVLRFMFELSRFTHAATPIVFKLIDMLNKCIGGIFILITMVWRDLISNRGGAKQPAEPALSYEARFRSLEYRQTASSMGRQRTLYVSETTGDAGDSLQ